LTSLVARLSRVALGGAVSVLTAGGLGTAGLMHAWARHDLDRVLLLAAQTGHAAAEPGELPRAWANEHHPGAVAVRTWSAADPVVDLAWAEEALRTERPTARSVGDQRVLVLAVEPRRSDGAPGHDEAHPHGLRVAQAALPAVRETVLPFALAYLLVAAVVSGVGALLLPGRVRRALRPLDDAAAQLSRVRTLGAAVRLPAAGPDEVAGLLSSVNTLLERLQGAVEAQTRFTADAAHELRTPVAALRLELDLARRGPAEVDALQAAVGRAHADAARLAELVEGLMRLARVDAGQIEEARAPARPGELAAEAARREAPRLEAAGVALQFQVRDDPPVRVHAALLEAAVGTLLRNVAAHAPGAPARLTVRSSPGRAWIELEDAGPGIAPEARDGALRRFGRGDRRREGLGLGLPLAAEVAQRHGGGLLLETAPTGGLLVRMWLPTDIPVDHEHF
jgi:signal transduction histidine kinase